MLYFVRFDKPCLYAAIVEKINKFYIFTNCICNIPMTSFDKKTCTSMEFVFLVCFAM